MSSHRRWYLVGADIDRLPWREAHPELPAIDIDSHLDVPRTINPWDEVVYLDSYTLLFSLEERQRTHRAFTEARARGRLP